MKHVDNQPDKRAVRAVSECVSAGDFYSCEEAIHRLNDYLDHELTEEERLVVLKHLEICKSCLPRFTFEQTLIVSLRQKLNSARMPDTIRVRLHTLLHITE